MVPTLNFLVPSLHPNTLVDLCFPSPTLGAVPSAPEPIVQHLPIKYGTFQPLGRSKKILATGDNQVVIADDKFQISTLDLSPLTTGTGTETEIDQEEDVQVSPNPPVVKKQESIKGRSKDIWAGLIGVENGVIAALTSGQLTYHPTLSEQSTEPSSISSSSSSSSSRSIPSPLQCLTSTSLSPNTFVTAGKEIDVSIWDIERTFGSSGDEVNKLWDNGKRKKNVLEIGQIWQAKNVPQNNLSLRQPINHLSLTYLTESPYLLVSGTKAGTVRRYDTRQRKPLSDWKVAKEGGVGCVAAGVEHELFFSDHSNLLASLDLRTGKILYTYSSLTSTPNHIIPIPTLSTSEPATRRLGLASISSDASFRLHTSTTPPAEDMKGNFGGDGKKGEVIKMVGGIGIGQGIFRGYSERNIISTIEKKVKGEGQDADDEDNEEEVWQGMDAIEDTGVESSEEDLDSDSESDAGEEDRIIVKSKPKKKARNV
ncbi:uncharacterized protein IL334_004233 [Kwoniella shivajii]|uniref:Ribosome biogenesis protein NSA1 n=1 Tax=Kwoniella shivajii TaxID=564305 RepID=A0ABZ1D2S6_9TREE|nr:hypothetical protein IL334_004233 [Kwoniella shivajii]